MDQGKAEAKARDIAKPLQMTKGNRTKITNRYVRRWTPLKEEASVALGRSKRNGFAKEVKSARHERSALLGTKSFRKCRVSRPEITYSKPVSTAIQAASKCSARLQPFWSGST